MLVRLAARFSDGSFNGGAHYIPRSEFPEWVPFDLSLTELSARPPSKKFHILLLGDSVDRYLIDDGCGAWSNSSMYDWAEGEFVYKFGSGASQTCTTLWGSMSFLHLYGAPQAGPYLNGHVNTEADPFTDTPLRIKRALALYVERFGFSPRVIVYQSCLWDVHRVKSEEMTIRKTFQLVAAQEVDLLKNLRLLREILPSQVAVFTRTTPHSSPPRIAEMTNALRRASKALGIGVLDWDLMMRGEAPTLCDGIFRDAGHPTPAYSRAFIVAVARFVGTAIVPY